jgi:hypothetical protein
MSRPYRLSLADSQLQRSNARAPERGGVDSYWPGDGYVDWVAADGFNPNTCDGESGWTEFGAILKAFYAWGSARSMPMMISETGTVEDPGRGAAGRAQLEPAAGGRDR